MEAPVLDAVDAGELARVKALVAVSQSPSRTRIVTNDRKKSGGKGHGKG